MSEAEPNYGEPWKVSKATPNRIDTPSGGISVDWSEHDRSRPDRNPYALAETTARRIVACVNALAGIPTEEIEAGILVVWNSPPESTPDAHAEVRAIRAALTPPEDSAR